MTDRLLQEKAQGIINSHNGVCDMTEKADLKLSRGEGVVEIQNQKWVQISPKPW